MNELPRVLLELTDVTKSFPGVVALDRVSFDLHPGEVHALVGENGAGKSTLINIVSGVLIPDAGNIILDGKPVKLDHPFAAHQNGILTVHQEADLFGSLSVAENMALFQRLPTGRLGFVDWRQVEIDARNSVHETGGQISTRLPAERLSVAHRHMIQVAAALTQGAKIVILDEPTSALSESDARWLFTKIDCLKKDGAGVIYITHRQEEIFMLADRITVLRDGKRVWSGGKRETNREQLINAMVGRRETLASSARRSPKKGPSTPVPLLRVEGLSDRTDRVREVSFNARAGEILGIYGLVGAGRTELAHILFGLRRPSAGRIEVDGARCSFRSPQDAIQAGLAYVPEDRLREGICSGLSVRANTVLSSLRNWTRGFLANSPAEMHATEGIVERLGIRLQSAEQPIGTLSGGNQQKVVLGRWLLTQPRVLVLDEPTRGVDVGAKAEIHRQLRSLADEGCAVVMISSELPEVMANVDRVIAFREGTVAAEFNPSVATAAEVATAVLPQKAYQNSNTPTGRPRGSRQLRGEIALLITVLALGAWLAMASEGLHLVSLLTSAALWSILGLAAASVIVAGGIDISIGSLLALAATSAALVLKLPIPSALSIPLAIVTGMLVGTAGGALNAAVSLWGRVHPIVVTLGTMTIYRGLVILLLGGKPMTGLPPEFGRMAIDPRTGFRGAIVLAVVVIATVYVWLAHTRSGRHLYALGAGPTAARLAGISRTHVWFTAFGVGGLLTGVAGVLQLSMSQQMQARLGAGWELSAIAIAVIGGFAITGGRGTVWGVVLAALLLRMTNSALVRWEVQPEQFDLLIGALILGTVLLDLIWRRRAN